MSYSMSYEVTDLPDFKFYKYLSVEIIDYAKQWGFPYKENLILIRKQAQADFLFSLKNLKMFWQSMSQFIVIVLITWVFRYAISSTVGSLILSQTAFWIITLQMAGAFVFIGTDIVIKRKKLEIYESYFFSFYLFRGFLALNMPFQLITEKANLTELINKEDKFMSIREALKTTVEMILHQGGEGANEKIELICEELKYKQEQDFDETHKIMNVCKMIVILFFFFPAYLLNIHEILNGIPF